MLLVKPDWLDARDVARLTSKDAALSKALRFVQSGNWPLNGEDCVKALYSKRHELSQCAGVLLWGHRVVVPEAARRMVLQELHVGHPGIVRMKAAARAVVWWPGIDDDIERAVGSCRPCQESRSSPQRAELHMWPWPGRPWSRLHIDFAELTKGKYILVVVDSHSKWIEVEIMSSTASAPTVSKLRSLFARWGIPDMICTDNATTFTSSEFQEFLRGNGVAHRTIEPKHSRGNGLAERAVKEVKLAVQRGAQDGVATDLALQRWLFQQRTIQHATTSVSPAELMIGWKPKSRLDLLYPDLEKVVLSKQVKQKSYADKSARPKEFHIGDSVYARNYAVGKMWLPATVLGVDGPVSYVVRLDDGRVWRRHSEQLRHRLDTHSDEADVSGYSVPPAEDVPDRATWRPTSRPAPAQRDEAGLRIRDPAAPPTAAPVLDGPPAAAAASSARGEGAAGSGVATDPDCGDAVAGAEARPAEDCPSVRAGAPGASGERVRVTTPARAVGAPVPPRRSARVRREPDWYRSEQF